MSETELVVAEGHGYRILEHQGGLIFARRAIRGPAILAWVAGGAALVFLLLGAMLLLFAAAGPPPRTGGLVAGAICLALGAAAAAVARQALALYRLRQAGEGEQRLFLDGALRDAGGRELAPRSVLRTKVSIDPTDGMGGLRFARVLWLHWPGGRWPIYKSYAKDDLGRVREALRARGLG